MYKAIEQTVRDIREKAPLIHNITNLVVTNITANALLAIGASPLMAHEKEELEEILAISSALVINIGTLDEYSIESMKEASKIAKRLGKPTVLDPVGAGASKLRTKTAIKLQEKGTPCIIRGNSSEILAITQSEAINQSRGVDSSSTVESAMQDAKKYAYLHNCVISISGEIDFITDGIQEARVQAITESRLPLSLITQITGMGCTATALSAACAAVAPTPFIAAVTAMAMMAEANAVAIHKADGPATLQLHFIDALYNLDPEKTSWNLREIK